MRRTAIILALTLAASGLSAARARPASAHARPASAHARLAEKDVTLDVGRRVARILTVRGFSVRTTRRGDASVSLAGRAAQANRWGAALFVSIHADSSSRRTTRGTAVIHQTGDARSETAARTVLSAVTAAAGTRPRGAYSLRGRRGDLFYLLRTVRTTAVLVETAAMTNAAEARSLASPAFRDALASGIADGVSAYVARTRSPKRVVIDPGHGGRDPGAIRWL